MAFLDELNTSTKVNIVPGLVDNVFKNDPLLAYVKNNTQEYFHGGSNIQENFVYSNLKGKAYEKGAQFNISKVQSFTGGTFSPKFYQVNVTEFLEETEVQNKGPEAVFRMIDADMQNAALSMSAFLAISLYNNGIRTGFTPLINGLAEICNDGTNNSWDTQTYTTYGTLTRGGTIGSALTSVPVDVAGAISYQVLEEEYGNVTIGAEMPNIGVTTNLGYSYIKQKFQTQQRFNDTQDPAIGFNGMKFNAAVLMQSQYAPGTGAYTSGSLDSVVLDFLETEMGLTSPTTTAETIWFLNTKWFTFWVSDSPLYGFGFTGFKPSQDNTQIAGQYLYSGNITCQSPRLQKQLFGVTS